ncbi:MAG: hypothetical protein IMZ66_01090 [Planctomycetes bacterium]|nr:hypothetical protein [Planctomycetota bacterium]
MTPRRLMAWPAMAALVAAALAAPAPAEAPAAAAPTSAAPATRAEEAMTPGAALAGLAADDVRDLRKAAAYLEVLVADESEYDDVRAGAIGALGRVHEALNDWDRPGLADWYFRLLESPKAEHLRWQLLPAVQAAAKAGQHHLGGVREFWRRIEASRGRFEGELAKGLDQARKDFEDRARRFERPAKERPVQVNPFKVVERKIDVGRHLKPYPEPKPEPAKK